MKPFRHLWVGASGLLAAAIVVFALSYHPTPVQASPVPSAPDAATGDHAKGPAPLHISHGEEVNLPDYFVPGKVTIFDFFSEYCPPCRAIGPYMAKLHDTRPDMAVVEVDINRPGHQGIDWGSPVAQQFHLHSIPHFVIVGPDGKTLSEGDEAYQRVLDWINALGSAHGV